MRIKKLSRSNVKRGDTIIEAMFAFAVFSLVAIITVSMMNLGIAASERSLELVTARNELNAQAEALRFIHSSYVSELNLPTDCAGQNNCQQYKTLWSAITDKERVLDPGSKSIDYPLSACNDVYQDGNNLLIKNHAFVINTRKLRTYQKDLGTSGVLVDAGTYTDINAPNPEFIFQPASLNARIIYGLSDHNKPTSDDSMSSIVGLADYTDIKSVEGIWVIGVKGPATAGSAPQYYDFYIETCWYGSNNSTPTSLDTIVRLYNPEEN